MSGAAVFQRCFCEPELTIRWSEIPGELLLPIKLSDSPTALGYFLVKSRHLLPGLALARLVLETLELSLQESGPEKNCQIVGLRALQNFAHPCFLF